MYDERERGNIMLVDPYEFDRKKMVKEQIIARGIQGAALIKTLLKVPRHLFVDQAIEQYAYQDHPLPIGLNQTISQPYIVALMTEKLDLRKTDRVLEIGTGSGYQTAILSQLAREIFTVERLEKLQKRAIEIHSSLGYENIHYYLGNGYEGWKTFAPYDAIIVTASPHEIPDALLNQLAENGRMIIPINKFFSGRLLLITKKDNKIDTQFICDCRFVEMVKD